MADNVSGLADIDASIVIQVLTSHNNQQLQRIKRHFRALFGKVGRINFNSVSITMEYLMVTLLVQGIIECY